jgi:hypothetical protein
MTLNDEIKRVLSIYDLKLKVLKTIFTLKFFKKRFKDSKRCWFQLNISLNHNW